MELLNNCHSVSAEWERKEEADQLGAESDEVFFQLLERTIEFVCMSTASLIKTDGQESVV
jgi:hypothetical protein